MCIVSRIQFGRVEIPKGGTNFYKGEGEGGETPPSVNGALAS